MLSRIADLEHRLALEREALATAEADTAQAMRDRDTEIAELRIELKAVKARAMAAVEMLNLRAAATSSAARTAHARMAADLMARVAEAEERRREISALHDELAEARENLRAIITSTIWRAGYPLRFVGSHVPVGFRKALRRGIRLGSPTAGRPRLAGDGAPIAGSLALGSKPLDERDPLSETHPATHSPGHFQEQPKLPKPRGPRALVVDSRWPRPDQDSGSLDAMMQIRALQGFGYEIVFASEDEYDIESPYRTQLQAEAVICLSPEDSPSIDAFLQNDGETLALCILSRVYCGGRYLEGARRHAPQAKIIFNTVDLHHLRLEREGRLLDDTGLLRRAAETRERELYITRRADATIVVSSVERVHLERSVPDARIFEMPLARKVRSPRRFPGFGPRSGIGFVGGFEHSPNVDAVRFLLADIWPLVLEFLPQAQLSIVGNALPAKILESVPGNMRYLGQVDELDSWLDTIRLTVAPLRFGAGAKGKVISSLAAGVPCVSTSIGAEGMQLDAGLHLATADTPEEFAMRIVEVHENAALWKRLSEAGHQRALEQFSIQAGQERLRMLLHGLNLPVTPSDAADDPMAASPQGHESLLIQDPFL